LNTEERSVFFAGRAIAADPDDPMLLYNVACNYAQLGRTDDALMALEQAVDRGYGDKSWMEHDSDLDAIRPLPRYQALPLRDLALGSGTVSIASVKAAMHAQEQQPAEQALVA
jgi:hypothetical protein